MDLLAVLKIAARRWYILAPLLLLTVVGAWGVAQQVKPTYEIDGILPLTAPYVTSEEDAELLSRNTFLDFITTGTILGALGDSADIRAAVEVGGGDPEYEIVAQGAVLTVNVSTDSPQRALNTYQLIAGALNDRLDAIQADGTVPPPFRITISDSLRPGQVNETLGNRQRVLIASGALGFVLSIAICVFVDYLLVRPQPRRLAAALRKDGESGNDNDEQGDRHSNTVVASHNAAGSADGRRASDVNVSGFDTGRSPDPVRVAKTTERSAQ